MDLEKLKNLLGIPDEDVAQDTVLEFVLEDVKEIILNYCNLEELPDKLVHTGYRMAMDLYRCEKPGDSITPLTVTSISEGGTSTSFTYTSALLTDDILKDYKRQLNRFRKVEW